MGQILTIEYLSSSRAVKKSLAPGRQVLVPSFAQIVHTAHCDKHSVKPPNSCPNNVTVTVEVFCHPTATF